MKKSVLFIGVASALLLSGCFKGGHMYNSSYHAPKANKIVYVNHGYSGYYGHGGPVVAWDTYMYDRRGYCGGYYGCGGYGSYSPSVLHVSPGYAPVPTKVVYAY